MPKTKELPKVGTTVAFQDDNKKIQFGIIYSIIESNIIVNHNNKNFTRTINKIKEYDR